MKTTSTAFDLTVYCNRIVEVLEDGNKKPNLEELSPEAASEMIGSVLSASGALSQIMENYFNRGDIVVAQEKAEATA